MYGRHVGSVIRNWTALERTAYLRERFRKRKSRSREGFHR
jgi:hypothetical protein